MGAQSLVPQRIAKHGRHRPPRPGRGVEVAEERSFRRAEQDGERAGLGGAGGGRGERHPSDDTPAGLVSTNVYYCTPAWKLLGCLGCRGSWKNAWGGWCWSTPRTSPPSP